jgi:hypothetical protein
MRKNFLFLAFIALFIGLSFNSCKKDDNNNNTDNGKIDPSTVAASNLVAYFPFESATASISKGDGITFSKTGGAASFVAGRRGNAYQGNLNGAYLEYNVATTNPFKTMKAFTIAAWIKTPPAIVNGANGAAMIFQLNGGDATMGNLAFDLESNSNQDSLDIKGYLFNAASPDWKGQEIRAQKPAFLVDKWVHITCSYNNANSTMSLYANGSLVVSAVKWSTGVQSDGSQPLLGDLSFSPDMSKIYIGAWFQQVTNTGLYDWMRYFPGLIDELRIYNKALSDQEVSDLYNAEVTQVNP